MLPTLTFVLSVGRGRLKSLLGVTDLAVDEDGTSVVVVKRVNDFALVGYKTLLFEAVLIDDFVVFSTDDGRKGFNGFFESFLSFSTLVSLFFNSNLNCSG